MTSRVTHLWEVALAVADEQACFAAATVADDDNLLGVGGALGEVRSGRLTAGGGAHGGADGAVTAPDTLVAASARRVVVAIVVLLGGQVVAGAVVVVVVRVAILRRRHDRATWVKRKLRLPVQLASLKRIASL